MMKPLDLNEAADVALRYMGDIGQIGRIANLQAALVHAGAFREEDWFMMSDVIDFVHLGGDAASLEEQLLKRCGQFLAAGGTFDTTPAGARVLDSVTTWMLRNGLGVAATTGKFFQTRTETRDLQAGLQYLSRQLSVQAAVMQSMANGPVEALKLKPEWLEDPPAVACANSLWNYVKDLWRDGLADGADPSVLAQYVRQETQEQLLKAYRAGARAGHFLAAYQIQEALKGRWAEGDMPRIMRLGHLTKGYGYDKEKKPTAHMKALLCNEVAEWLRLGGECPPTKILPLQFPTEEGMTFHVMDKSTLRQKDVRNYWNVLGAENLLPYAAYELEDVGCVAGKRTLRIMKVSKPQ